MELSYHYETSLWLWHFFYLWSLFQCSRTFTGLVTCLINRWRKTETQFLRLSVRDLVFSDSISWNIVSRAGALMHLLEYGRQCGKSQGITAKIQHQRQDSWTRSSSLNTGQISPGINHRRFPDNISKRLSSNPQNNMKFRKKILENEISKFISNQYESAN